MSCFGGRPPPGFRGPGWKVRPMALQGTPTPLPQPDGFGAGFGALMLLVVLAGLAVLLGLVAAGTAVQGRRGDRVPDAVSYLAGGLLVAVVVVAGFGVLALSDEAAFAAGLFVVLVFLPLGAVAVRGWRAGRDPFSVLATTAMAWAPAFLLGLATFLAVTVGLVEAFGLAGGEFRALGLDLISIAGGGVVAIVGTALLEPRLARLVSTTRP